jgi:CubicO group peptidase (beta-lactamase class C family)
MSKLDAVWRSLDETIASGWAPGVVAGVRLGGETEFYATGTVALDSAEPMREDTLFRIASLSKLIGGALAVSLIADGTIGIDDPVSRWLPELASPRVLVSPDAALDQTVPAERPITVRHLLTFTHGLGAVFEPTPLADALRDSGVRAGPIPPRMTPDEFMARIAEIPLAHQPGERWMYHSGSDILSVLMSRAAGKPLHDLLADRITGPLGMESTAFFGDARRLSTAYRPTNDGLLVFDRPEGDFSEPPPFETFAGGLVSTVPDYLRFLAALADDTLLPRGLREQMTSDQLTPAQRVGTEIMLDPTESWGWQVSVDTETGHYGWTGGTGTSAYVDPKRDLIGVVMTQRMMAGPNERFQYFWEPLVAVSGRGATVFP